MNIHDWPPFLFIESKFTVDASVFVCTEKPSQADVVTLERFEGPLGLGTKSSKGFKCSVRG